jgi:hypothetical protein
MVVDALGEIVCETDVIGTVDAEEHVGTPTHRKNERRALRLDSLRSLRAKFPRRKLWCGREDSNLHGIATASPSSWCVCQFRHYRTVETTTF